MCPVGIIFEFASVFELTGYRMGRGPVGGSITAVILESFPEHIVSNRPEKGQCVGLAEGGELWGEPPLCVTKSACLHLCVCVRVQCACECVHM